MSGLVPAELTELVRHEDVDLVALSEEQCAVLWLDEEATRRAHGSPLMQAALRTLIAAGLAQVDDDDQVGFVGPAALIAASRAEVRRTLTWGSSAEGDLPGMWVVLGPEVLLEQVAEPFGILSFRLLAVRRAMSSLVTRLLPDGAAESAEGFEVHDEASASRLAELQGRLRESRKIWVLDSGPLTDSRPDASTPVAELTLLGDGLAPGWLVEVDGSGLTSVTPVDRVTLRRRLLQALAAG